MESESDILDLRGLKCPMPALLARRTLQRSASGALIEVIADDPLAYIDIPHMCAQEGFAVLSVTRENGVVRLVLSRTSPA